MRVAAKIRQPLYVSTYVYMCTTISHYVYIHNYSLIYSQQRSLLWCSPWMGSLLRWECRTETYLHATLNPGLLSWSEHGLLLSSGQSRWGGNQHCQCGCTQRTRHYRRTLNTNRNSCNLCRITALSMCIPLVCHMHNYTGMITSCYLTTSDMQFRDHPPLILLSSIQWLIEMKQHCTKTTFTE